MSFTPFEELNGSPTLDLSGDGSTGTREAIVNWSDITPLIDYLFIAPLVTRQMHADLPFLFARSVHIEPFFGDKQKIVTPASSDLNYESLNTYAQARVRIEYSSARFDSETIDFTPQEISFDPALLISQRWSIGGEFITIKSAGLDWCGGEDVDEDVTAGFLIPTIEHEIVWHRVVNPPFSTIRSRLGKVNEEVLNFGTGTIEKETLLFLGADMVRDILSNGALAWELTYRFSERRVPVITPDSPSGECDSVVAVEAGQPGLGGWNHFYRSEKIDSSTWHIGFFRLMRRDAVAGPIYEIDTFVPLFQQA